MSEKFPEQPSNFPKRTDKDARDLHELEKYIVGLTPEQSYELAWCLSDILSYCRDNDDEFIGNLSIAPDQSACRKQELDIIKKALSAGNIKENAPWFKALNEAVIRYSIYVAGADGFSQINYENE